MGLVLRSSPIVLLRGSRALLHVGLVTLGIVVCGLIPAGSARAVESSVPATRSVVMTITAEGYDVDFTLPTAAKAGCTVCHGDPDLVRLKDGKVVSFFVDPAVAQGSAHESVNCTGCHLDFAFTAPHPAAESEWEATAKAACKNCHKDQFLDYGRSVHRIESAPETPTADEVLDKPLCGDCHSSHDIKLLADNPEGQLQLRRRGYDVCGSCHQEYWDNYDDYYHGAAFKRGAQDAPACWDCHRGHEVLPSDDRDSSVNERHLVETCAQCHAQADERYVAYAAFIHHRNEAAERVVLRDMYLWIRGAITGLFGG